MIVAGEMSGDAHAAELVRAMFELLPETKFEFFGATGERMRQVDVETIINSDDLSIVGLPEIARALPMFWRTFQILKKAAIERKPDVVVLVDFPDFNMKLAKSLKKVGLKIIYYISPQLWAWRKYRKRTIEKYVDLLLTILPFEKNWYQKQGIEHVEFVGNPLAGKVKSNLSKREFCEKYELDSIKPIIALLPGSRYKEIVRILPTMLESAVEMSRKKPDIQFVVALASNRRFTDIKGLIEKNSENYLKTLSKIKFVCNETREVLNAADAAAVTSGTATLETAIIGTPLVIVYKTSDINYSTLRPLIRVPHFGLINLIAEKRLATELIQNDFTKERLSTELGNLLEAENNKQMRKALKNVVETLGSENASKNAAEAILKFLERQGKHLS